MMTSFLPFNSEQKEQTNKEKYVFYCSVSQIHINLKKNKKQILISTKMSHLLAKIQNGRHLLRF